MFNKKDGSPRSGLEMYNAGSILCEGLTFKDGNLEGVGKITLNCCFMGNIYTNDLVIIEEVGAVTGNIEAKAIVIKGKVEGNVDAIDGVKIYHGGILNGDITCSALEISDGAAFIGSCNMTSVREERRQKNVGEYGGDPIDDSSVIPLKSKSE